MNPAKSVSYMLTPATEGVITQALADMPFGLNGLRRICLHSNTASPLHVMMIEAKDVMAFPAHSHSPLTADTRRQSSLCCSRKFGSIG